MLIAVDTAVKPLLAAGISPDVVVAIDPSHEEELRLFEGVDMASLKQVPLVYFPRVHPEVLRLWPGPRMTAYCKGEEYSKLAVDIPKGTLFSAGTVFHPAVDLAIRMGAAEVVFLGADFAYPNGASHVAGSAHARNTERGAGEPWVMSGRGEKIGTALNLRGFLRDLEHYIEGISHVRFVNASREGALIRGTSFLENGDD